MSRGGDNKMQLYARAAALIVAGEPYSKVAAAIGVDRVTLYFWRRDPAFTILLDELTEDVVHAAKREIRCLVNEAVDALRDSLSSKQSEVEVERNRLRLAAAERVLNRAGIAGPEKGIEDMGDEAMQQLADRLGWTRAKDNQKPKTEH
jgi:transposase-like protein